MEGILQDIWDYAGIYFPNGSIKLLIFELEKYFGEGANWPQQLSSKVANTQWSMNDDNKK